MSTNTNIKTNTKTNIKTRADNLNNVSDDDIFDGDIMYDYNLSWEDFWSTKLYFGNEGLVEELSLLHEVFSKELIDWEVEEDDYPFSEDGEYTLGEEEQRFWYRELSLHTGITIGLARAIKIFEEEYGKTLKVKLEVTESKTNS